MPRGAAWLPLANGAAGIIPSVAHYYLRFMDGRKKAWSATSDGGRDGVLYKRSFYLRSRSGRQGEVGVAAHGCGGVGLGIDGP